MPASPLPIVVAGLALSLSACASGSTADTAPITSARASTVTVLYEVEGTAKWADVTMETPTGTEQLSPDVPMVRKDSGKPGLQMTMSSGHVVYLSAQNKDSYGNIRCRITAAGTVISENTSSGGYAIATCNGIVP